MLGDSVELDLVESLKNVFIFSRATLAELKRVARLASFKKYKRGERIYWEEDRPEGLHVLVDGKIKLLKEGVSGRETIVGMVNRGETFGELAVLDGRPFETSSQAMEPSTVAIVPRGEFMKMLKEHPEMCFEIIIELTRRLREAQEMIQEISSERVEQRIIFLLLKFGQKLGERRQGAIRIGVHLTRQDIADMIGSTVETTIRVLSRLTRRGLIETRSKIIILKDPAGLRELAEEGAEP